MQGVAGTWHVRKRKWSRLVNGSNNCPELVNCRLVGLFGELRFTEYACQAQPSKIFLFPRIPISIIHRPVPCPSGGAMCIVT